MAKSRRRARKPAPQAPTEPKEPRRHHAAIWLATLSTVVGIATGMFTLRDQVFPRESGSAQAVSVSAYQAQVGRVCDALNSDDSRRARQVKTIHKELKQAKTTTAQRNALLDGQRQTIARSGDALASLVALEPPEHLRATERAVKATWNRNLARLRSYAERLDSAGTRPELVASVRYLATLRTPLAGDGVELMAGLRRLGGANCDLRTPINTNTFPLPPLKTPEHSSHSAGSSGSGATSGLSASTGNGSASSTGSAGTTGATSTPPPGGGTGTAGTAGGGAGPSSGTGGSTGGSGGPANGGGGSGG